MWDCMVCGCQSIAGPLTFCPQCYADKDEHPEPEPALADAPEDALAVTDE